MVTVVHTGSSPSGAGKLSSKLTRARMPPFISWIAGPPGKMVLLRKLIEVSAQTLLVLRIAYVH